MVTPAKSKARGMLRRASLISSAISDADSEPISAKMMTDQKTMSATRVDGMKLRGANEVAEPKCFQAAKPRTITMNVGTHMATAPRLCAHFARLRPRILRTVKAMRTTTEKDAK